MSDTGEYPPQQPAAQGTPPDQYSQSGQYPAQQPPAGQSSPGQPQHGGSEQQTSKHNVSAGQILAGILLILIIIFVVENSRTVTIRLIIPQVHAPLYVAILISAVVGALVSWLLRLRRARSAERKRLAKEYRAEQKAAQKH